MGVSKLACVLGATLLIGCGDADEAPFENSPPTTTLAAPAVSEGPLHLVTEPARHALVKSAADTWNRCGGRQTAVHTFDENVPSALPVYFVGTDDEHLQGHNGVTWVVDDTVQFIKVRNDGGTSIVAHEIGHALMLERGHFGSGLMHVDGALSFEDGPTAEDCAALVSSSR